MKSPATKLTHAAIAAALYVVITLIAAPISYGPLQLRLSEILMILPYFMPETAAGLAVGCFIVNIGSVYGIFDMILGSLATGIAAFLIARSGKRKTKKDVVLTVTAPAVSNGLIVGAFIAYLTAPAGGFFALYALYALQIGLSELIVMMCAGLPILIKLPKTEIYNRFIAGK